MKKLKNKVFFTIFIILTCFLISILSIFNYQDYNWEKENIKTNLTKLHVNLKKEVKEDLLFNQSSSNSLDSKTPKEDFSRKIFMDFVVYTVLLNDQNEISEVFSHNEEIVTNEEIVQVASQILTSKDLQDMKIGNLYISNYSYSFREHESLTIIDNRPIRERLLSTLKLSLILFGLLEIVIIYLSKIVTNWIIKSVLISFNKQKQFIADASHELKTPLAVIMASSDALENDRTEDKWLRNIKNETERMNQLISDLLDLARLEEGNRKDNYHVVNLSKMIEIQVLSFESLAFERDLFLKYEIEKGIMFHCDGSQMKQLVSILLDNAIRHSDKKKNIQIKLTKEKEGIVLMVTNQGKEIPKAEQEKIFERFYRGDKSRNRNENRYGLGLAIAKNIVLNHHGKISVVSNGGYTTFKVILK